MTILSSFWNQSNGHGRRDGELDSSVMKMAHHVHQHAPAGFAVQLEDGDEHDCKDSRDHEVEASEDRALLGGHERAGVRLCVLERVGRVHGIWRQ